MRNSVKKTKRVPGILPGLITSPYHAATAELSLRTLAEFYGHGMSKRDLANATRMAERFDALLEGEDAHQVALAALQWLHGLSTEAITNCDPGPTAKV